MTDETRVSFFRNIKKKQFAFNALKRQILSKKAKLERLKILKLNFKRLKDYFKSNKFWRTH